MGATPSGNMPSQQMYHHWRRASCKLLDRQLRGRM